MTTRRFRRGEEAEGGAAEGAPARSGGGGGKPGSAIIRFIAGALATVAAYAAFYGPQIEAVTDLKATHGILAFVTAGGALAAVAVFAGLLSLAARGGFEAFCLGLLVPAGLFAANLGALEDEAPKAGAAESGQAGPSGKKKSTGPPMRAISLVSSPVSSAVLREREKQAGATEKAVAEAVGKAKAEADREREKVLAAMKADADAAREKAEKEHADAFGAARAEADAAKARAEGLAKSLEETQQKLAATEEGDRKIRAELEQERNDLAGKLSVAGERAGDREKFEAQAKDLARKLAEATVRVPILERDLADHKTYARWVESDILAAPASGLGILSNRISIKAAEDRRAAARLLRMFGTAAVPLLRKAEQDPDEGVRAAARESLAAVGK
ncbi:MAG: hypothetical protein L0216_05045 [Planctomycetales bacterium]|nr:hypothetical protein [Planctomycetales bacterium]